MIFKNYILEQNPSTIVKYKMFLFYGENLGLQRDFKENIKNLNKDTEIIRLYQDEILKDANILITEVFNKSLFEEKKIIIIEQATDKLLDIIEEIEEEIQDEKILVFSEKLEKRSKLRNFFEKNKGCGVTACYNDNEITIRRIITNRLNKFDGLTTQIINLLIQNTNLDRNKVINEIEKIESCFLSEKLEIQKIEELLNIKTNEDFSNLRDEVLNGNKSNTNRLLADTDLIPENNIYYINIINQRLNKLKEINELKKNNTNVETLISNLKPPIFWKDKPIIINQLRKWGKNKIREALQKTYKIEIQIKSDPSVRKDLLIKNLLVDLCCSANSVLTNLK